MAKPKPPSDAQRMHALMIGQPLPAAPPARPRAARKPKPAAPAEPHPLLGPAFNKPRVD